MWCLIRVDVDEIASFVLDWLVVFQPYYIRHLFRITIALDHYSLTFVFLENSWLSNKHWSTFLSRIKEIFYLNLIIDYLKMLFFFTFQRSNGCWRCFDHSRFSIELCKDHHRLVQSQIFRVLTRTYHLLVFSFRFCTFCHLSILVSP